MHYQNKILIGNFGAQKQISKNVFRYHVYQSLPGTTISIILSAFNI